MQEMHKSQNEGNSNYRPPVYYNLDVIISVGYRVKSKRGIAFRKWANKVLEEHLIQGYSLNQKRLDTLAKVIDIQNRMLSYSSNIDKEELTSKKQYKIPFH